MSTLTVFVTIAGRRRRRPSAAARSRRIPDAMNGVPAGHNNSAAGGIHAARHDLCTPCPVLREPLFADKRRFSTNASVQYLDDPIRHRLGGTTALKRTEELEVRPPAGGRVDGPGEQVQQLRPRAWATISGGRSRSWREPAPPVVIPAVRLVEDRRPVQQREISADGGVVRDQHDARPAAAPGLPGQVADVHAQRRSGCRGNRCGRG